MGVFGRGLCALLKRPGEGSTMDISLFGEWQREVSLECMALCWEPMRNEL